MVYFLHNFKSTPHQFKIWSNSLIATRFFVTNLYIKPKVVYIHYIFLTQKSQDRQFANGWQATVPACQPMANCLPYNIVQQKRCR